MVLIRGRRADRRWTGTVVEYSAKKWDSPGLRCAGARSVAHAAGVQRTSRRQLAEKACSWPHARASAPKLVGLSVASLLPAIGRSLRVRHEHFTDPDWRVRSVEGPTRHGRSAAHVRRCDRQMSMQKVPRWSRCTVPPHVGQGEFGGESTSRDRPHVSTMVCTAYLVRVVRMDWSRGN